MDYREEKGLLWFRLWEDGPGFLIKNTILHPELFSERTNRFIGFRVLLGTWLIRYLEPRNEKSEMTAACVRLAETVVGPGAAVDDCMDQLRKNHPDDFSVEFGAPDDSGNGDPRCDRVDSFANLSVLDHFLGDVR